MDLLALCRPVEKGSTPGPETLGLDGGMQIETGHEYSNVQLVLTHRTTAQGRTSFDSSHRAAQRAARRLHVAKGARSCVTIRD